MYPPDQLEVAVLLEAEPLVVAARPWLVRCLADGSAGRTRPRLAPDMLWARVIPEVGIRVEDFWNEPDYPFVKPHLNTNTTYTPGVTTP